MITRHHPLLRKTPLRRCSKKHARELRTYFTLRADFLAKHPQCEVARKGICTGRAGEVHHTRGRGKHLNDVSSFLATCAHCHRWVHEHAGQARVLGFIT